MKNRGLQSGWDSGSSVEKLRKLRSQYKTERAGYHACVHETMARTMSVILKLPSSERALQRFLKLTKANNKMLPDDVAQSWITKAVMEYVMDAKSESAKKIAWKRARVLDHLHDFHGIPPKNIAVEIRERGGIEAVIRLAAEEDPLRPKTSSDDGKKSDKKTGASLKLSGGSKSSTDYESGSADDDESGNKTKSLRGSGHTGGNDDTMLFSIDHCLRRKLLGLPVGRRVKLIGIRTDEDGRDTVFEVRKVAPIPSGIGKKIAKKRSKNN